MARKHFAELPSSYGARARAYPWQQQSAIASIGRLSPGLDSLCCTTRGTATATIGTCASIASDVVVIPAGNHCPDWGTTFRLRLVRNLFGARTDGSPPQRATS